MPENLRSRLRLIREAAGLTCKQVGDKLGLTEMTVSRYEREPRRLTLPLLREFSSMYGATLPIGACQTPSHRQKVWNLPGCAD